MKKIFYGYTDKCLDYRYGGSHPLKGYRLYLAYQLSKAYSLLESVTIEEPQPCPEEDLLKVHDANYVQVLKECNNGVEQEACSLHNLHIEDNPVFEGVYDWASMICGGSLQGAKRLLDGTADIYFNITGGMHHGMPDKASGFCYLNDAAVAINYLMERGKKVLYIDIDAHHGDGVQSIFYKTHKVMTISYHESGKFTFPQTGFENEIGAGDGEGFAVNFPLYPYTDDSNFLRAFFDIVPMMVYAFSPDVIVTQLGVDCLHNDPLATLNLTTRAFEKVVEYYKSLNLPWLALGGGGYNPFNVARAWTLALSIMTEKPVSDPIPDIFKPIAAQFKINPGQLRDPAPVIDEKYQPLVRQETTRVIEQLQLKVFPHHHLFN